MKAAWEYRLFQAIRRHLFWVKRPDGWPNRDHPRKHRFWRHIFGSGRVCYYCGLEARP